MHSARRGLAIKQVQCRLGIIKPKLLAQLLFIGLDRVFIGKVAQSKAADNEISGHVVQGKISARGQFSGARNIEAIGQ